MANKIKADPKALERVLKMKTLDEMMAILKEFGNPDSAYKKGTIIVVENKMQKDYEFELAENPGENFASDFRPRYTPSQMLTEGVFGGKYCNDQILEYPASWYNDSRLSPEGNNTQVNRFKQESRTPISGWIDEGWINPIDPRGWFEWYMRYWLGRRVEDEFNGQPYDRYQINRWKSFARHFGQVKLIVMLMIWNVDQDKDKLFFNGRGLHMDCKRNGLILNHQQKKKTKYNEKLRTKF
jgi:hypothetical protein